MKLFNRKAGNKVININGTNVKFVNCVAEVEDEFGKEALKLGLPNLYEHGKQPVFETPKEVQMKSDFNDREEWYKKEIARLTNINTSQKKKIEELEQEVVNWKSEYEKEHEARLKLAEGIIPAPETVTPPAPENPVEDPAATTDDENPAEGDGGETLTPEQEEEELRKELSGMKKDELIAFGTENGFDMAAIAEKTKAEIIEFLVASSKE
jgi:hypothetical protein